MPPEEGATNRSVLASEGLEFLLISAAAGGGVEAAVPLSSIHPETTCCLFFSAGWCRPCRDFTQHLVELYHTLNSDGIEKQQQQLEIILVSSDRDESGFVEHISQLPWPAAPFDPDLRRRLQRRYSVDRIPALIPLTLDGAAVEEDAVQLVEDYGAEAFPFGARRRQELKAADEAKRRGCGSLVDLLGSERRDYLVTGDGGRVPISDLVEKKTVVALYFAAHWGPPCRSFTAVLADAHADLLRSSSTTTAGAFEVVFVSMDRDEEEFDLSLRGMPWPAIPFSDARSRHDLGRVFGVKGIPALVPLHAGEAWGEVAAETDARAMVETYGAAAFPFTAGRVAAVREEGEALPRSVRDPAHVPHVLELDMVAGLNGDGGARFYVCDRCGGRGRFWVFSCAACDFDLHPACVVQQQWKQET